MNFVFKLRILPKLFQVSQFNKNGDDAVPSIDALVQTGKIPFPPPPFSLPLNSSFFPSSARLCNVQNPGKFIGKTCFVTTFVVTNELCAQIVYKTWNG